VDDYLTEHDQWEALQRWMKENGAWIAAGVIIGAGALYGWRWWQDRVTARAQVAAAQYSELLSALGRDDEKHAIELSAQLQRDYSDTPYWDQAQLALARADVEHNALNQAAGRLQAVMERSGDKELRQVARLRLARVLLAQNKLNEALAVVDAAAATGAFVPRFNEVRGDILLAKGDRSGALLAYRAALTAAEPGVIDDGQLRLKINDLSGAAPAAPETAVKPKESHP
jgi:predicted negative regulator of RcsB-dependent stress response